MPAASVARAVKLVIEFGPTVTARPGDPNAAAVPDATSVPSWQAGSAYTTTVEPACAEPLIRGARTRLGDAGDDDRLAGAGGGVSSSTYVPAVAHADRLPAASTASTENVVVESSATDTVTPSAKAAAVGVTAGDGVQPSRANTSTVEPASAVPLTFGLLSRAGDGGEITRSVGASGAVSSST